MAWEIESHHVDLVEMEHVTHFIERGVRGRGGEHARYVLQIRLGDDLKLTDEGHLIDSDGNPLNVRERQLKVLEELNKQHERARAFARRHGSPIFQGKK